MEDKFFNVSMDVFHKSGLNTLNVDKYITKDLMTNIFIFTIDIIDNVIHNMVI